MVLASPMLIPPTKRTTPARMDCGCLGHYCGACLDGRGGVLLRLRGRAAFADCFAAERRLFMHRIGGARLELEADDYEVRRLNLRKLPLSLQSPHILAPYPLNTGPAQGAN